MERRRQHPEIAEMRERLERTASSGRAIALEGLSLLAGVYAAISPWVVHERMFRLAWTIAPFGVWLLVSPWVVTATHGARAGIAWNNCRVGAVTLLLG
ncbi:SPW repeat protein [Streptomyces sp. NPDC048665]|uniref:SPW repeat domain-containing protein n=2 Tax=Streptomyces TaxID=1883 RepID=UPI003425F262